MKNIIILILIILELGLGSYIIFDKIIDENNKEDNSMHIEQSETAPDEKTNDNNQKIVIEQKDVSFFNEYLSPFLNCSGWLINSFDLNNDDNLAMFYFATSYYNLKYKENESLSDDKYIVSSNEMDDLINKYFGISEYNIQKSTDVYSIVKENNNYVVSWKPVGCPTFYNKISLVEYDNDSVKVTAPEYNYDNLTGKIKNFYLKNNNGNYNLDKIETVES